ncbi:MAG TPA: IS1634 family transposase [Candidatus Paceibacterota bacterium]|nr:IS1634 family transposase [Candidatus Paceibacterota bacterium]
MVVFGGKMFIKRTIGGTKEKPIAYLQLAQSYRDENGKPRHRILCTLGKEKEVIGIAEVLAKRFAKLSSKLLVLDKETDFLGRSFLFGPVLAAEAIWRQLNLDEMLKDVEKEYKVEYDLSKCVKLMTINRLCEPKSKLSIMEWKEDLYCEGMKGIELQHLYRSLDILAENKDFILKGLYRKSVELFKAEVKVVFYDLTTLYSESVRESLLKRFGYSKKNKSDCVQVVMGLVISRDNIPLYYELFPGNTYEGSTVKGIVEAMKRKFEIEKVIFVGDKGLLGKGVLAEIEKLGLEYIVSAKISQSAKKDKKEIFTQEGMREIGEGVKIKEIKINGRRMIVGYSEERKKRDRAIREELIEKIKEKIKKDKKGIIAKPYYRTYLDIKAEKIEINEEKIKLKEEEDGYFGFWTNNKELKEEEILKAYKMLWQIEASFRCLKSSLDLEPLYHYTPKRIEGHTLMCFISFYILNAMTRKIEDLSYEKIIESLKRIRVVEIKTDDQKIFARTEISGLNNQILRSLNIKIPPTILKEENVVE